MFKRILIANRGEIACRIARSCTRLGVEFVAVYSDADAGAAHLNGAAATVHIGESAAASSYLDGRRIVQAALDTGCEAVHPGYGFLSENAGFARAVTEAGLVFIGPRADTIDALGDKGRAKQLMRDAGVPVVPGSAEATEDAARLNVLSDEVGYPLLLKPSAGGGGKGMQIVRSPAELPAAIEAGVRLARSSFGDGRLLAERYVERPRHIEVQVFGDSFGNVVHAHERECSLQRRHQKVVEEAPATTIGDATRSALVASAVEGARAVRYVNAGTFEFIVGENGEYFFLEVNTRLQVEHPVSEELTGLDFVEWQLRIASGEKLPRAQADIPRIGHAIEARVYAEDPAQNFRPAPGQALRIVWPEGVRVETSLADGGEITPYYDPMVAKVIVHAANRADALAAMSRALAGCAAMGLTTNLGLLEAIASDEDVKAGRFHTRFLDGQLEALTTGAAASAAAACALAVDTWHSQAGAAASGPWGSASALLDRPSLSPGAPLGVAAFWEDAKPVACELLSLEPGRLSARAGGQHWDVTFSHANGLFSGTAAGLAWWALDRGDTLELQVAGWRRVLHRAAPAARAAGTGNQALAPMHGVVVALNVKVGDQVAEGDTLVVLEAMKMENQVRAPRAGKVAQVRCEAGASVAVGQVLVELAPAGGQNQ
ncbi:MAG: biotin/lipoyl-binding protein [Bdellovibrionales bacterium]|nr:biotin/lipoyl-binding protein [Ramlibacter sp.]